MSIFSKPESYLGVDIGANGIKLVELRKTKNRPQLWTYGIAEGDLDIHLSDNNEKNVEELVAEDNGKTKKESRKEILTDFKDPRVDKYASILKELIKASRVSSRRVTASLPVSYVFHAIVNLPKVAEKEIEHVVRAEVKKMLPRPIEQMQVVHQIVPESDEDKKKKYMRVLVTAAPKELVVFYTSIFQKAGLQLMELETEAFALERSLVGHDTATVMIVDMGAERTNFFIIDQGLPLIHRSINFGGNAFDKVISNTLGIEEKNVLQIKKDISRIYNKISTDLFVPVIDPIQKEIEYGFDLFLHQIGNENKRPEKIILTGGSASLPFIKSYLSDRFNMKVFVGDPWARVIYQDGLKILLDSIGPRLSVSIGLALRNIV